ncbi:hypothetical protein AB0B31_05125 [Catellatospora citrea]|uniref:hypothetical protein n=1 Tax=Catellatospora citrea TaxID=53366 RepID=UPI0033F8F1ED
MDDVAVPASLRTLLTAAVARELASAYSDEVVFPDRIVVDHPGDPDSGFPEWPAPVLVISIENQGVCRWGVPLDRPDPLVLVGGELFDGSDWAEGTVAYAPDVAHFIAARRWDGDCLSGKPLLQAQAAELAAGTLGYLRAHFTELLPTRGFPGRDQFRFERRGVKVMLWSGPGQCDWWISGTDADELRGAVGELTSLADLRDSLWSDDPVGDLLR